MSRTHDVMISAFDLDRIESELDAVTEQRDRLAEALRGVLKNTGCRVGDNPHAHAPKYREALLALAAVKSQPTKS
jgi:hypothetical protein